MFVIAMLLNASTCATLQPFWIHRKKTLFPCVGYTNAMLIAPFFACQCFVALFVCFFFAEVRKSHRRRKTESVHCTYSLLGTEDILLFMFCKHTGRSLVLRRFVSLFSGALWLLLLCSVIIRRFKEIIMWTTTGGCLTLFMTHTILSGIVLKPFRDCL